MEKVKNEIKESNEFINEFVKCRKGDTDIVVAAKAWRSAESALKTHISALEGDSIELEDALSNAGDDLKNARVNQGFKISNRSKYIEQLVKAKNMVILAEENFNDHLQTLDFLKEEYANMKK